MPVETRTIRTEIAVKVTAEEVEAILRSYLDIPRAASLDMFCEDVTFRWTTIQHPTVEPSDMEIARAQQLKKESWE